jgi:hypothetical protein
MLRRALFLTLALSLLSLVAGADNATLFKVRIENVSTATTLKSSTGQTTGAGLSPGLFILFKGKSNDLFVAGHPDHGKGLERLAEDGNPGPVLESERNEKGVISVQVFNTPVGMTDPGPIGPGGAYEFTFTAKEGTKLTLAQMFGQSNDLFYAPDSKGIDLFDKNGSPISGDITSQIRLWDAGTEVNQEPGFGSDQAPRQHAPNTGAEEHNAIGAVNDGFTYPSVDQVLKVTITHE